MPIPHQQFVVLVERHHHFVGTASGEQGHDDVGAIVLVELHAEGDRHVHERPRQNTWPSFCV